ncbi:SusC/RagA family TonB-linked outer membrane protein [Flavobacteriaceae bacterium]|nr:SusC/RagA family TonB-linked outer membrane protein [Flavobacteriaceae bacterium]
MNFKLRLTLVALMFISTSIFAQEGFTLNGVVAASSTNDPLPGVSVVIKGSSKGVPTDFDGNFSLEVQKGDILTLTFMGYAETEYIVGDADSVIIKMVEDQNILDEVVVIGYGLQKKSHLTGAISKVVNTDLDQIPVARVDDALKGQVSGVNIASTDGGAGSAPTIRIRGTGSITGDSGPLIVVDGLVMDSDILGSLDMNDVESFEVLKDAASAAIYGSRGGNGVIMITTKGGKIGDTQFSFNVYGGYNEARQSEDYYLTVADAVKREMAATGELSDKTLYKQAIGVDNPWQNIIFDGGWIQNYSFGARGGTEKTKFSSNLNYMHDEGVLLTDDFKKYSGKVKVDTKLSKKFSFGISVTPTYTNTRRFDGSTHDILRQPAWLPLYHDENTINFVNRVQDNGQWADVQVGDYARQYHFDGYDLTTGMPVDSGGTTISSTSNTNPGAKVLERERRDLKFKVFSSTYLKYKIADGLNFKTTFSHSYQNTERTRYQGTLASRNGVAATQSDYESYNINRIVSDNYFNYNKSFNTVHEFGAIAGVSTEYLKGTYAAIRGTGYENDNVETLNNATAIAAANNLQWDTSLLSFVFRANYAYADKYLFSVSVRSDGSSIFGEDYKYGTFPAASIGWNVAKEGFLEDSNFISRLKLRASYGVTGNNNIRLAGFSVTNSDVLGNYYPADALLASQTYNGQAAFNPINIANNQLQWERSVELNPGIDYGFFNGRIYGSIDAYTRRSDQLLLSNPVSATTGFNEALVNLGEVKNSGIEFEFRADIIDGEKFTWKSSILTSWNQNELVSFGDSDGQIQNVDTKRAAEWINSVGNPISSFYGWVVDKEIPLEYIKNPWHPVGAQAQDVYVKDLNGDGIIDDDDKTILGDPYPDFIWSFTNNFTLGNLDFGFMFQGSHGAQIRNMADQYIFNHFNSAQDFDPLTTPDQGFIKQKIFTNSIVQDASYIALRNVNIAYNFPKKSLKNGGMSSLRIYAAGSNLMYLTADGYTGFNPESVDSTSPTTYGYQRGGSPIYGTISVGINAGF